MTKARELDKAAYENGYIEMIGDEINGGDLLDEILSGRMDSVLTGWGYSVVRIITDAYGHDLYFAVDEEKD